jgi:CRP/FNR family transcriptional regulator
MEAEKDGKMSARIVHLGEDRLNRLGPLRKAGYSVDLCQTLDDFRLVLTSGVIFDALAIVETQGISLDDAIAIAYHGSNAPLILFQGATLRRRRPEFSLIVPILTQPITWLAEIAEVIAHSRKNGVKQQQSSQCSESVQPAPSAAPHVGSSASSFSESPQHGARHSNEHIGRHTPSRIGFHSSSTEPANLHVVRSSQFLKALPQEQLREMESITSLSLCAPGTVLFVEGQEPHEIFVLLEGQARVFMNSHDGRRLTIHIAGPGEILGLAAAFTSALHKTSAETLYPSRIACIPCVDFLKFVAAHPEASQATTRELSEICDRTYTRLRTIAVTPSNRAKLARLLLEWTPQGKSTDRGVQIHVGLKHGEIAECIGTCRESVTRILRDLQRWQVIELRGSLLTIMDMSALEQCAGQ